MQARQSAGMKKKLHFVVTVLCLLTLFLNTASCMVAQLPRVHQASCGECPSHAPLSQDTPVCCKTHQQPSAVTNTVEVKQPASIAHTLASPTLDLPAHFTALPAAQFAETPPIPLLISLRI
jgi:hypothetical protein